MTSRLHAHRLVAVSPDSAAARAEIERLLAAQLASRPDLVGVQGPRPGSGRSDGEFWEHGRWFLKTRADRAHRSLPAAQVVLERVAEVKRKLAELAPVHTYVALLRSGSDVYQVWTVAPRLTTLREQLDSAQREANEAAFRRALLAYAHALGLALAHAVHHGMSLDANPGNFAPQGGRIRYIDDDVALRSDAVGLEDAFLARFAEYPRMRETEAVAYVRRFAAEALTAAGAEGIARIDLVGRMLASSRMRPGSERWLGLALDELARAGVPVRGKR